MTLVKTDGQAGAFLAFCCHFVGDGDCRGVCGVKKFQVHFDVDVFGDFFVGHVKDVLSEELVSWRWLFPKNATSICPFDFAFSILGLSDGKLS